MKTTKYSVEFFINWLHEHKRLPRPNDKSENMISASMIAYRKKYPALNEVALKYKRGPGYKGNTFTRKKSQIRMNKDLQKLGLFLAESGGTGWF